MKSEVSENSSAAETPSQWRIWAACLLIPVIAIAVDLLMRNVSLPFWARAPLALLPLAPGVWFLRELRQIFARADELAMHIVREALAFVFFALLGVFIVVDLLENGGVLRGFVWDTKRLAITMTLLALVGSWLAARRYR